MNNYFTNKRTRRKNIQDYKSKINLFWRTTAEKMQQRLTSYSRLVFGLLWFSFFVFILWNISLIRMKTSFLMSNLLKPIQNEESDSNIKPNRSAPSCPPAPKVWKFEEEECYKNSNKSGKPNKPLEDFFSSSKQPNEGRNIFFVETSCAKEDGRLYIHPK